MNNRYIPTMSARIRSGKWFKKRFKFIMMMLFLVLAVPTVLGAVFEPESIAVSLSMLGGATSLAIVPIISIGSVSDADVSPNAINIRVYLIATDQLSKTVKFPQIGANREVPTIALEPGEYMQSFECHTYPTFLASGSKDSGAIVMTGTNTFTIVIGGFRDEIAEFIENFAGKRFIIIFEDCESDRRMGMGSKCQPVLFSGYEYKNDGDGRYATLTFTQSTVRQPWTYIGDITEQDPVDHTADATSLAIVAGNNRYNIPDGSAATYAINAVTGLTAADKGRVIDLIGQGVSNSATVVDGSPFILVDGTTWTADKGSTLSLRVMDASGTLVEISRS